MQNAIKLDHGQIGKCLGPTLTANRPTLQMIADNARELLATINKLKPASAKGTYMKSVYISSTMSPGITIDKNTIS